MIRAKAPIDNITYGTVDVLSPVCAAPTLFLVPPEGVLPAGLLPVILNAFAVSVIALSIANSVDAVPILTVPLH